MIPTISTLRGSKAWPHVLLTSTKLALTYERARAPTVAVALVSFLGALSAACGRIGRVGLATHVKLSTLELEFAEAGLSYRSSADGVGPPWTVPEAFIHLAASDLPAHPLIEPTWLSSLVRSQGIASPGAVASLAKLLSTNGLGARWRGIPTFGNPPPKPSGSARVAVCLHLFYPELWPILRAALDRIPEDWDLFITIPEFACTQTLARIATEHPSTFFMPCKNRGRDVLPFLRLLEKGAFDRYDAVCKLHSKRSLHMNDGAQWLNQVLQSLLGSPIAVAELLARFRNTPKIGVFGPEALFIQSGHRLHPGSNQKVVKLLAARAGLPHSATDCPFFAGTMFWFRPKALERLRALAMRDDDFPLEMGQTDGTPAHAIERLIGPLVEQAGFQITAV